METHLRHRLPQRIWRHHCARPTPGHAENIRALRKSIQVCEKSGLGLGLKLVAILAGALCFAGAIRVIAGEAAIKRHKAPIDGFNILILFVFVAAVMGTVMGSLWADPVWAIELAVLAFAVFFALLGTTFVIFRKAGPERAFALGLMVSQRNMGLMLAATQGVLPGTTWLYFAMSQFPIYLSPQLLKPLANRLQTTASSGAVAPARET